MPVVFGNAGSGRPYINFSADQREWRRRGPEGAEVFNPYGAKVVIDIERTQFGWLKLEKGAGRDWSPWPNVNARTKQPTPEHRMGFLVHVYAPKLLGDEVYEFSANSAASTRFIGSLFNEAEKRDGGFGKGRVALVSMTGSKPVKIGKGSTEDILFTWEWTARPAALEDIEAAPVEEVATASKPEPAVSMYGAAEF